METQEVKKLRDKAFMIKLIYPESKERELALFQLDNAVYWSNLTQQVKS